MTRTTLQAAIQGSVLEPGDPGYDEARAVWNGMIDRRPRYVVRCAETADVVAAVRYAADLGLELGISCGGHGIVGHAVPDDGLMIDLRPMGAVTVDPLTPARQGAGRRAPRRARPRIAGARPRDHRGERLAHRGRRPHPRRGMGWLARRHGLTCDNVVSFELVTANGDLLHVDADSHPDLDWALRGGGGNFGVVTAVRVRPASRAGAGDLGRAGLPARGRPRRRRDATLARPERRRARGRRRFTAIISGDAVSLGLVWVGDPVVGRARIAEVAERLTDAAEPARRSIEPLTYLQLQTREDDVEGHDWRRYWKGHYFSELGDALIDALLARDGDDLPDVSLQAYGGAIADVPDEQTAFAASRDRIRVRRRVAVAQPRR